MATVLVKPNGKKWQYGKLEKLSAIEPPLWMALLANYYHADALVDMEAHPREITEEEVIIIATGNHPSAHVQQTEAAIELQNELGRGTIVNKLPTDPVSLGKPRWDLLDMTKYRAHNWQTWGMKDRTYGVNFNSISCPFTCSFCIIQEFYGSGYKERPWEETYSDFLDFEKMGITNIKMADELFLVGNTNTSKLLGALQGAPFNIWAYARIDTVNEELLKAAKTAGVNWICYGIETADEKLRRLLGKGSFTNEQVKDVVQMTKKCGINVLGNFMYGFEGETEEGWKKTFDLAQELNCEYSNFYCYVDYHGDKKVSQYSKDFHHPARDFRDESFTKYHTSSRYLSMMNTKFGEEVVKEIEEMTSIKLERE